MPLQKIEWTRYQSGWAIWHIIESFDTLAGLAQPEVCPTDVKNPLKRMEWAAGRALMKTMIDQTGLTYAGLNKDSLGKPQLTNHPHFVSLSNSYPYVAAQLDFLQPVGIDLEQPKSKVVRIAHRVLTQDEVKDAGKDILKNCVYWCAKEALFKLHGKKGISFSEHLGVQPFTLAKAGALLGNISADGNITSIPLEYKITDDFVLVFSAIKNEFP